jgi:hypothetical protein
MIPSEAAVNVGFFDGAQVEDPAACWKALASACGTCT